MFYSCFLFFAKSSMLGTSSTWLKYDSLDDSFGLVSRLFETCFKPWFNIFHKSGRGNCGSHKYIYIRIYIYIHTCSRNSSKSQQKESIRKPNLLKHVLLYSISILRLQYAWAVTSSNFPGEHEGPFKAENISMMPVFVATNVKGHGKSCLKIRNPHSIHMYHVLWHIKYYILYSLFLYYDVLCVYICVCYVYIYICMYIQDVYIYIYCILNILYIVCIYIVCINYIYSVYIYIV